jgi:lipopolysaccharide assembly protein A
MIRFFCMVFLLLFVGAIGVFAWQNRDDVTLHFLNWTVVTSLAVVAGASYALGMLSGWSVVGMIRKSIHRVTDRPSTLERQHTQTS